jgi:hypothetical protein
MATKLDVYLASVLSISAKLDKEVDRILTARSSTIIGMIRNRLFQTGRDGEAKLIGRYHPSTIKWKQQVNQRVSFITLRDTGEFYSSMFLTYDKGLLEIHASSDKTPFLIQEYGEAILELTTKEQEIIMNKILGPEIDKYINSKLGQDIDLSFN